MFFCQQDLDRDAAQRLRQFEEFVTSTTERELRQLRETFARRRKKLTDEVQELRARVLLGKHEHALLDEI